MQGATGMAMHDPHYLARARELCTRHDVLLIADEIMTGFGRTGTMFACEQAAIAPDLICLSKGITGGYLPLSCVLSTDAIFAAFYADDTSRGFLHSHSYTGNALACRAALAVLDIFARRRRAGGAIARRPRAGRHAPRAIAAHPKVRAFRHRGMIWAFDVDTDRADFARWCFAQGLARELLLRPIGRTVYFMPPYILTDDEFALLVAPHDRDPAMRREPARSRRACAGAGASSLAAGTAAAALPREVGRAFLDAGVPLNAVAVVVQDVTKSPAAFHAICRIARTTRRRS